jgi:F-type H+-transporting ATPase subunit b
MGDKTGAAVSKVTGIAQDILGTSDAGGIERAIAADPNLALQFRVAVIQAEADARIAEEVAAAETRIRGLRDSAMASVGDIAVETAGAMVQRLTGTTATAADLRAAVKGAA